MKLHPLPNDYEQRVYAGVLGKIIGVYLGRPFEGWKYERIVKELGEICSYVHEQLGAKLIVSDDDISGTFAFFRALTDRGCTPDLTPEQIGETWLNYIVENKTILWWGGIGTSTEHTAWLRLVAGIKAPASGSIALNGSTVAEQIGAQIFIDAWGLVHPGDPERAADFARRAASVSHDGLAIHGAQVVAAMVATAFVEQDVEKIISRALAQIPSDSLIRKMSDDIRDWHGENPDDWKKTFVKIQEIYGYARYGGGCHIIPNHALIHLALRYSGGDFNEAQMIVNTAGWDTDCNAANVGCILGVANGLAGLETATDWRGPVADRILLPSADGGATITDALRESYPIINAARKFRGLPPLSPKNGARFHFSMPGSVQGFLAEAPDSLRLENKEAQGALTCRVLKPDGNLSAFTATFSSKENILDYRYRMIACPTLHPGQTVHARWMAPAANPEPMEVRLVLKTYDEELNLHSHQGQAITLQPDSTETVAWTIPTLNGAPIAAIGFEISPGSQGTLHLDSLDWKGAPNVSLKPSSKDSNQLHPWVYHVDGRVYIYPETCIITHSRSNGFLAQGSRDWKDYRFCARVWIRLAESFGLLIRAQGLRRHYSLRFKPSGKLQIVKCCDGESILAETTAPWIFDQARDYEISAQGDLIRVSVDGVPLLEARDSALDGGAAGFLLDQAGIEIFSATVEALA